MTPALLPTAAMPFGKYAGRALDTVPPGYWRWLLEQPWAEQRCPAVCAFARAALAPGTGPALKWSNPLTGESKMISAAELARACGRRRDSVTR